MSNNIKVNAFGTAAPTADLKLLEIERRALTAHDIEIDILFCGVCHLICILPGMTGVVPFILPFRVMRLWAELQKWEPESPNLKLAI